MIVSPSLSFRLVHSLAAARSAESLDGTEGIERGILSIVPAATQIGTEAAANALLGGAGTFLRGISSGGANAAEYRYQAGDDYDSQKAALRMALSAGGVAAGSALSGAVNASGLKLLRQLGKQNYVLPNVALGGASALGYAAGETGLTELSKAMTDEDYTPDWNAIGKTGLTAFAFGAITRAIDTARVSVGNKRYMKALNENVRERYNYAKRTIDDPRMTAQQKAQAANSVMDAADKMRYALDELQVVGAKGRERHTRVPFEYLRRHDAVHQHQLWRYFRRRRHCPDRAKCSSERAGRAGIPRSADRAGPPCCSVAYRSYRSRARRRNQCSA